ncbi:MAG TPA: glycoside hydrolase family 15 protein [Acidimicrobiales bacterium]|nr:glycoside hydrolase family 15 protein [Acidimicrobiales bacterium]
MTDAALRDYGLLGDTRTAALVDAQGSLDWLCLPFFDGEPVFARLVAGQDGGHFRVGPALPAPVAARRYRPDSTVLETEWHVGGARLRLTEGMIADPVGLFPTPCLVRRLEAFGGSVPARVELEPRVGVGRRPLRTRAHGGAIVADTNGLALSLTPDVIGDVEVAPGRPVTFVLSAAHRGPSTFVPPELAWAALLDDERRWRRWCERIEYDGPFAEAVTRSLLTLRLLTHSPSGAPVASPTTSLPEVVAGGRNWDYRYSWPRDAGIAIGAFLGVGMEDRARAFLYWLLHAGRLDRPRLRPVLTLYGRKVPDEREVPEWPGFADSRPVRFGNGAGNQHQLDTYGWVLDAMWLLVRDGQPLYRETWRAGRAFADFVARRWADPDSGIWEVRGDPAHWVHSKLMGWLALDRALRIAERVHTPSRAVARWAQAREAVAADVRSRGFDGRRGTYVRAYGRGDVDAALLVLPLLDFEPAGSARVRGTIAAVRCELSAGGPLLYRYAPGDDGLHGSEGAFLACSFWLVQALAATGAADEAGALFEDVLRVGEPLGLFAEEADPSTGALLGNHPQALTHAALVQAALALRDATKGAAAGRAPSRRPRGRAS